jgi:hypothetical protein
MLTEENISQTTVSVVERLSAMLQKELTTSRKRDYLDPSDPTIVTPDDRMLLVDWCYRIVDHCQFSRESVASAMEMADRFLSMPNNNMSAAAHEALHDRNKFQLLIVTALYVSIKVNERVSVSSGLFAEMCKDAYTEEEIENMELTLLSGLEWRCYAPTAHQVGLSILSLIMPYVNTSEATWSFLMDEVKYQTEHSIRDYYFSTQRPSTVALATLFNAMGQICSPERNEVLDFFLRIIRYFDFDQPDQVSKASKRLHCLLQDDNQEVVTETTSQTLPLRGRRISLEVVPNKLSNI